MRKPILILFIAFASYILLGLPNGLLGVAWPSIRQSFGLSLDALGTLLTAVTIGYIMASFNSGRLITWRGEVTLLMSSSILMGAGMLGYVLAPNWWTMVAFGLLLGLGSGTVDAGLNTYVAKHYEARHMNWLHACFGIGVTFGPLIMTAMLNAGRSWRWGYLIVVVLEVALAAAYGLTRRHWQLATPSAVAANGGRPVADNARTLDSLRQPAVWLGIALFILHPGIEFIAGQWSYTLFTEGRAVAPTTASLWLSVYWASLTAGRLVLGSVADRIGVERLLRLCMLGILIGSALIWWNVSELVSFLGLAVIGFGVALLFPSMVSRTPHWVGTSHAANAIGFQVAAASVGIAVLPGLVGVLAERLSLEVIGPFLAVTTLVMMALFELLARRGAEARS
ncbi:MAG: MFS transporter [Anaerolineae bacterium]|nr:MFS transporter [Anaerolineae bacterium]